MDEPGKFGKHERRVRVAGGEANIRIAKSMNPFFYPLCIRFYMGCKVVFVSVCFTEELSLKPITNWVIADLANEEGRALVKAALQQMVRKYFESYCSEYLLNRTLFSI